MAFRIIVDGYNLIGAASGLQGNLEKQRDRLIERLSEYQAQKGHSVTLVFDGWQSGWAEEHGEIRMGVDVVFSKQGEKADAVVIRMARELGKGALIVSSDGDVVRQSQAAGAIAVSSLEFELRLIRSLRGLGLAGSGPGGIPEAEEEDENRTRGKKKGNPRKLSKQERKRRMRLNKL